MSYLYILLSLYSIGAGKCTASRFSFVRNLLCVNE